MTGWIRIVIASLAGQDEPSCYITNTVFAVILADTFWPYTFRYNNLQIYSRRLNHRNIFGLFNLFTCPAFGGARTLWAFEAAP